MDDKFVYSQEDLDKALANGFRSIILSAGVFMVPLIENTVYKRLGPVVVIVAATQHSAAAAGMVFENINPVFSQGYAISEKESLNPVAAFVASSSYGSFRPSGSYGSFGSGVYTYSHEYEFEYIRKGSFSGSFAGSYSLGYSFRSSYLFGSSSSSFNEKYKLMAGTDITTPIPIRVFGYGIELI